MERGSGNTPAAAPERRQLQWETPARQGADRGQKIEMGPTPTVDFFLHLLQSAEQRPAVWIAAGGVPSADPGPADGTGPPLPAGRAQPSPPASEGRSGVFLAPPHPAEYCRTAAAPAGRTTGIPAPAHPPQIRSPAGPPAGQAEKAPPGEAGAPARRPEPSPKAPPATGGQRFPLTRVPAVRKSCCCRMAQETRRRLLPDK